MFSKSKKLYADQYVMEMWEQELKKYQDTYKKGITGAIKSAAVAQYGNIDLLEGRLGLVQGTLDEINVMKKTGAPPSKFDVLQQIKLMYKTNANYTEIEDSKERQKGLDKPGHTFKPGSLDKILKNLIFEVSKIIVNEFKDKPSCTFEECKKAIQAVFDSYAFAEKTKYDTELFTKRTDNIVAFITDKEKLPKFSSKEDLIEGVKALIQQNNEASETFGKNKNSGELHKMLTDYLAVLQSKQIVEQEQKAKAGPSV